MCKGGEWKYYLIVITQILRPTASESYVFHKEHNLPLAQKKNKIVQTL